MFELGKKWHLFTMGKIILCQISAEISTPTGIVSQAGKYIITILSLISFFGLCYDTFDCQHLAITYIRLK